MKPIQEFKTAAATMDERAFVSKWPHPFLLCEIIASEPRLRSGKPTNAETRRLPPQFLTSIRVSPALLDLPDARVLIVEKSSRNAYSNRIFVGRTPTSDIMLPHQSISKSHAYFEHVPGGGWYITDHGSRNGTRVPGQVLASRQRAPLSGVVPIFFGSYSVIFFESAAFFDMLSRKLERP
jgi:hypothetical protein